MNKILPDIENVTMEDKTVLLTGGSSGLGYETALALLKCKARVLIASRNLSKGEKTVEDLKNAILRLDPTACPLIEFLPVDLSIQASVVAFCLEVSKTYDHFDIIVCNAGIMMPPNRVETIDHFELQLATNYFGHFTMVHHLLPLLKKGTNPKLVTLSSMASTWAKKLDFNNLQLERGYKPMKGYERSKLAIHMFGKEFQKQSDLHSWGITSLIAHPGIATTNLFVAQKSKTLQFYDWALRHFPFVTQSGAQGAGPIIYATKDSTLPGGSFLGPSGPGGFKGKKVKLSKHPKFANNEDNLKRLWEISEQLTSCYFDD
jgi:NAD(P)-dependent dehydrogenase (short-subunit alcohol dehydrogenase family)